MTYGNRSPDRHPQRPYQPADDAGGALRHAPPVPVPPALRRWRIRRL